MSPTLKDGDYAVSLSTRKTRYQKDDIVIVDHQTFQTIVKRIADISDEGALWLSGDNPKSTPSEAFGWIRQTCLMGKVFWVIRRPHRKKLRVLE